MNWLQFVCMLVFAVLFAIIVFYGMWHFVGGAIDGAEDMVKTARRAYDEERKAEIAKMVKDALEAEKQGIDD